MSKQTEPLQLANTLPRIGRLLGLDKTVATTVLVQVISSLIGPITLYYVASFLSQEEQGFYYTFASILALQIFLELGFSQCIVNYSSHEYAKLIIHSDGTISGDPTAKSRLISLIRLSVKWYAILSLIFVLVVGVCGHLFFSFNNDYGVKWSIPWWSICLLSAFSIITLPIWAFLEGCNQYLWIARVRIMIRLAGAVTLWFCFANGAGLYAASFSLGSTTLLFFLLFHLKWKRLLRQIANENITAAVSWKKEILPLQWRIALGWISGYFIFSLFSPVLFAFQGPIVAGRMGMTWALVWSIGAVASCWINTKVSLFGILVSNKNWQDLDKLWFKSTLHTVIIAAIGFVFAFIVIVWLKHYYSSIGQRLLGYEEIIVLSLAMIVNQIIYCQNLYMRAHKKEPFLPIFVLNAVFTGIAIYVAGRYFSVLMVCVGYGFFLSLSMIFTTMFFVSLRKSWHA